MEHDKTFFQDNDVLITKSRIVIFGKTYAMRNISSVSITQESKLFLKISSTIMLVFALSGFFLKEYLIGIIALGIAVIMLLNSKDEYIVVISSNSGDNNALKSKNRDYIESIIEAINEAIIFRGLVLFFKINEYNNVRC